MSGMLTRNDENKRLFSKECNVVVALRKGYFALLENQNIICPVKILFILSILSNL